MEQDFGLTPGQLETLLQILRNNASVFTDAGIFGSRASGTYKPNSDIDLVIYGKITERDLGRIAGLLSESSLPFTVDLVAYNSLPAGSLKDRIDADVKLLPLAGLK